VGPYRYQASAWQNPGTGDTVPPWLGVAVYNRTGGNLTLRIPPIDRTRVTEVTGLSSSSSTDLPVQLQALGTSATQSGMKASLKEVVAGSSNDIDRQRPTAVPVQEASAIDGWELQLILAQDGTPGIDIQNYVGVRSSATPGWEDGEYPEPPMSLDATARLSIDRTNRAEFADLYATDYVPLQGDGQTWPLLVESIAYDRKATLMVRGLEALPSGTVAALLDKDANLRIDLGVHRDYGFYPGAGAGRAVLPSNVAQHHLELIVGSSSYVDAQTVGAAVLPEAVTLDQNFPNPFNPTTTIRFALTEPSRVRLEIRNVRGQMVRLLTDELFNAGPHTVMWDGRDASGRQVASGIYFYRLQAGRTVRSKKMTLIR
jgi:hypothetical protein